MGQTLSNGVYLPNEGERNCYAGLASNWQILNTAVGNIAEKAPLVHTHGNITNDGKVGTTANKPLITGTGGVVQAGSFGNQANTFCEGNDSRLSDARTPVAHTHTKSDVTDLFNSANTWSGENKYTSGFILSNISWSGVTPPSSAKPTVIEFKNADTRQGRYINRISSTSSETWIETIRNVDANTSYNHTVVFQVDNSGNKSVYPYSNNDIDLGIATHQWNNLYAKNYYYNGTAWGLDKANVWSAINSYSAGIELAGARYAYILPEFAANYSGISILTNSFGKSVKIGSYTTDASNNIVLNTSIGFLELAAGTGSDGNIVRIQPRNGTLAELGTSTNKWKTLNGINPGALSLPNYSDTTYIDISGSIVPPSGETTINYSGGGNQYTPPVDGWLSIRCDGATFLQIYRNAYNCPGTTASRQEASGKLVVTLPVLKNTTYTIRINTSGATNVFQLYPCLGNV